MGSENHLESLDQKLKPPLIYIDMFPEIFWDIIFFIKITWKLPHRQSKFLKDVGCWIPGDTRGCTWTSICVLKDSDRDRRFLANFSPSFYPLVN